jgi:hypothetical protein
VGDVGVPCQMGDNATTFIAPSRISGPGTLPDEEMSFLSQPHLGSKDTSTSLVKFIQASETRMRPRPRRGPPEEKSEGF